MNYNGQPIGTSAGVNLKKGGSVNLRKSSPNLDRIRVGLGWDENPVKKGYGYDLDAIAIMVNSKERVPSNEYFIFFGNLSSPEGAVIHTGDNKVGDTEGDDEEIKVVLSKIPHHIERVKFAVTIYDAGVRGQNFGQISNAYIRVVDEATGNVLVKYDLTDEYTFSKAVVIAELIRNGETWEFTALGEGLDCEIEGICDKFGVTYQ